jgi:hypothetical protein
MLRERLKNVTKPEGPRLFVFDACRPFIRMVTVLPRDEIDMDDMDSAAEDHVGDETPYRLLSKERAAVVRQIWRPGNDEGRVRGQGFAQLTGAIRDDGPGADEAGDSYNGRWLAGTMGAWGRLWIHGTDGGRPLSASCSYIWMS